MKQVIISAVVAVIASFATFQLAGNKGVDDSQLDQLAEKLTTNQLMTGAFKPVTFRITDPLEEDAWLRGSARGGEPRPGPADDEKALADSANSVCFLTKVEFEDMNGPEDKTTCSISKDDFTGWWNVHATQGEGTDASVACEARCLVWE